MIGIDAIGLVVDDMGRALTFYRALGLPVPAEVDAEGHVEVELAGGVRLMLDTVELMRSFDAGYEPRAGTRMALAARFAAPEEVDRAYEQLMQAGGHGVREPFDAFWGQRYATVTDPDGNAVDLYAPRPSG